MNLLNFIAEGNRLCERLDLAQAQHLVAVADAAAAQSAYKAEKARVYVRLRNAGEVATSARELADGDARVCELREVRDTTAGQQTNALEAIKNLRQQISLLQSAMAGQREEMGFARTGPQRTP